MAVFLDASVNGLAITQYREGTELIDVVLRGDLAERSHLGLVPDLAVPVQGGRSVPLAQLAHVDYGFEDGVVWRRNLVPTVTVRANVYETAQASEVVDRLGDSIAAIEASLPLSLIGVAAALPPGALRGLVPGQADLKTRLRSAASRIK